MKLEQEFKGKKILVTGHTGFKGAWLCLMLLKLGAKVCGYSLNPDTSPNLYDILNLKESMESKIGDIRDFENLKKTFDSYKPEIIFHLAAQPIVRYSYEEPRYTFETNAMGTVNILECVRLTNCAKAIVNVTSDKCYENLEIQKPYKETDKLGGYDPYSSSKAVSELITSSYRNSFFNTKDYNIRHQTLVSSARAGNVIGGGDWAADRLVPDCIRAIRDNREIVLRNPYAVRPWQHVFEPLRGYMILAANLYKGDLSSARAWNFGPNKDSVLTVSDLTSKLISYIGKGSYKIESDDSKHEANLLMLDNSDAVSLLNWHPVLNIENGIKYTTDWYNAFYSKKMEMREYSINMFEKYNSLSEKEDTVRI